MIEQLKQKVLEGGRLTREEALALVTDPDKEALYRAGGEVRDRRMGRHFDTCSIVNARSGRCSEDCKWCAQSVLFRTGVHEYDVIGQADCLALARENVRHGIDKFSFVTSGRALPDRYVDILCGYAREIGKMGEREGRSLHLCASMGLLTLAQLRRLREAGITRYHCNLEASHRFFPRVCSTHTTGEKVATLRAAREAGMEVCSGGIIGMGETMEDRVDLALMLRELEVKSIPLNVLNPIPGTPLEGMSPLTDEEYLTTVAMFRLVNPDAYLRFAGGRTRVAHLEERAMKAGINAAIMGDMLTTAGPKIMEDKERIKNLGFNF